MTEISSSSTSSIILSLIEGLELNKGRELALRWALEVNVTYTEIAVKRKTIAMIWRLVTLTSRKKNLCLARLLNRRIRQKLE